MTPSAIIALVKDIVILIALGLAIWLLINYGKDIVKVQDMKNFQAQFEKNLKIESEWREGQERANEKHDIDLAKVNNAITGQRTAVLLCHQPPAAHQLPAVPAQASSGSTAAGGTQPEPGIDSLIATDIRPQLNEFELKAEKIVADCRRALDGWPQ
ncbi:MAG TPA: hypothetical protein VLH80_07540 [Nitrospiraceae bacterium]|nr:hypothetical protein [Nitrospiraceae bacterium]